MYGGQCEPVTGGWLVECESMEGKDKYGHLDDTGARPFLPPPKMTSASSFTSLSYTCQSGLKNTLVVIKTLNGMILV